MTTSPILLIFGAGPNSGQSVSRAFLNRGYKVALAARSVKESDNTKDQYHYPSDLTDPNSVVKAFERVNKDLGIPNVVVYNAGALTRTSAEDPLAISISDFNSTFNVNTVSVLVAAQQAILGFSKLPKEASKTFIYTGNILNEVTMAQLFDGGVGKAATAHMIEIAAGAYKDKGYKFYYADERKPDGSAIFRVNGDAHADQFLQLAEAKEQVYSRIPVPPENPLSLSLNDFQNSLNLHPTKANVAAQQAIAGFDKLPSSAPKTFIYTGNCLNTVANPGILDIGLGKSTAALIIETAADAYKDKGYNQVRFYYALKRAPNSAPAIFIDGEAHGKFFLELPEGKTQGHWSQTLVKGEGYKAFPYKRQ
ncbi:hypothetical protein CI109_105727 [Kwoniella shandongensis]|uniref:Uncharacterized protein n=1 Tax=Kwoniella shandongensis TaxID=1734106 RepID=A0A5M6C4X5_9TREE|nr:uncharacterized protein CI109_003067 [Kwoniella shandongensis]KAA5528535.1 hypothetical protein CI109_003067 [Kwoniella shandongensis]